MLSRLSYQLMTRLLCFTGISSYKVCMILTLVYQQPSKSYNFPRFSPSHHTNSVWFWRVQEKCELRMPPCYFCVLMCDTSISYILYDFTQSPICPVMRNSRLKMASLMATVHHNVPYRTTPPHPQTYRTIRIIFKVIGIIILSFITL